MATARAKVGPTTAKVKLSAEEKNSLQRILMYTGETTSDFFRRVIQEQHAIHVEKKSPGVVMNNGIPLDSTEFINAIQLYAAMLNATATTINATATQINISAANIKESSNRATQEIYNISILLRKLMNWSIMMYRVLGKPILFSYRLVFEQYRDTHPIEKFREHNDGATKQLNDGAREIIEHEAADHELAFEKYKFIAKDSQ